MPSITATPPATDAAEPGDERRLGARLRALNVHLGELFQAGEPGRVTPAKVGLAVVAVAVGTVVSLLRQPGYLATDTIWAEDGRIFLADAVNLPFLEALVTSYNGYYQAIPRLLVEPAQFLPASWAAGYLAVVSALAVSLFGLLVYVASGAYIRPVIGRLAVSAVAVVVPIAQDDLPNSVCNVHWAGLYALFWVLLWVPRSRTGQGVALVSTLLVAATNICAVVFLPLAIARVLGRRDRLAWWLAGLLTLGTVAHLLGLLFGGSSRDTHPDPINAVRYLFTRVIPGNLAGERWFGPVGDTGSWRWPMIIAAYALVGGAVWVAWKKITRPNWRLAVLGFGHAGMFWVVSAGATGLTATRYGTTTGMLLVTGLVALLLPGRERVDVPLARQRVGQWALTGFAVFLAVICAVNLRLDNRRADGPAWPDEIARVQAECARDGVTSDRLQLTPGDPEWQVSLPCSYLTR